MTDQELNRFMRLVKDSGACWEWIASTRDGYGIFATKTNGKWKNRRAHRVSYEHFIGPIGDLLVCHRCDNPRCVNPEHLFLGTVKDNALDASQKGRIYKGGANTPWNRLLTHCKRGHELSEENLVKSKSNRRVCKACMRWKWKQRKEGA